MEIRRKSHESYGDVERFQKGGFDEVILGDNALVE
jgi:hypothetical protein